MSYCIYCADLPADNVNKIYHDQQYGFLIQSDNELFGRLILEINQAGLSWQTILKKEANFRAAFDNYDIATIANYNTEKFEELLQNAGIIRNRLKINAVIYNANQIMTLQKSHGSFYQWLDENHKSLNTKDEWVKLFKKNFKFVGGEIVNEFLMSIGFLKGAHDENCKIFRNLLTQNPKWLLHENNN